MYTVISITLYNSAKSRSAFSLAKILRPDLSSPGSCQTYVHCYLLLHCITLQNHDQLSASSKNIYSFVVPSCFSNFIDSEEDSESLVTKFWVSCIILAECICAKNSLSAKSASLWGESAILRVAISLCWNWNCPLAISAKPPIWIDSGSKCSNHLVVSPSLNWTIWDKVMNNFFAVLLFLPLMPGMQYYALLNVWFSDKASNRAPSLLGSTVLSSWGTRHHQRILAQCPISQAKHHKQSNLHLLSLE